MPGGNPKTERKTGNLMRSPFQFRRYGQRRLPFERCFPHIAECVDDICMIRSVYTDIPIMSFAADDELRPHSAWAALVGLLDYIRTGTENRNLPGFIVLCGAPPNIVGPPLWNSAFLRAVYQGTFISDQEIDPQKQIPYLRNDDIAASGQRRGLDLLTS